MNATVCETVIYDFKHDTEVGVFSNRGRDIFESVAENVLFVSGMIGLLGITSNIINIIIFYKQGFNNTVNIAFLALAISDLCCLFTLEWISICMNSFVISGLPWAAPEVMYLSGGWPHICFSRITSYITVYITAERYLSIALPLKVKQIVTPTRTTLILILIYIVNLATLIPEYATSYLHWKSVPGRINATIIGLVFTSNRNNVEGICYVIHSLLSMTSLQGVVIFTAVLIIKLRRSSKWRKESTSRHELRGSISAREQKTVKMIVLIASVLIFCNTPGAIISMSSFIVGPELSITGKYLSVCVAAWSFACSFQIFNSSVNIFLYYKMSSKYKETFIKLFSISPKRTDIVDGFNRLLQCNVSQMNKYMKHV